MFSGSKYIGTKIRDAKTINVTYLPVSFRSVFASFPYFNMVQSAVIDTLLETERNLVVSAPTGSGKTVLFELALLKALRADGAKPDRIAVYLSPMKSLCGERYRDSRTGRPSWARSASGFSS